MRVLVEVCVTSIPEALAAERAGADSIELCSWLACGGVTPSYGLVNTLREKLTIPMRVLIRPTPGGFVYHDLERQIILRDSMLIGLSNVGIVVGGLDNTAMPDALLMKGVHLAAPENEITFHRAIDHANDQLVAIDTCALLGARRVLTSGGTTLVSDSLKMLRKMIERAGEKVLVAAAGGINGNNVVQLVESTGVGEVHFSALRTTAHPTDKAAMSSAYTGMSFETEPNLEKIDGVMNALVKAGFR